MRYSYGIKVLSSFLSAVILISAIICMPASALDNMETSVPKIVVNTAGGNGLELEKSDGYVNADISITDVDGSAIEDSVSFKVRGNTTALSWIQKKAFTFKFSKKKDVLGMGKGKKWALIANAFDPTLLRNYLAFETARELGLEYTSNQKFVELWLDGSFRGSYVLYEPVQAGADRVDIDAEGNGGMKDFLVEYETETAMVNESDTYFKADNIRFIAQEPEDPDEAQLEYLQNTLTDIIQALKSGDKARIEEKVDLASFVKYYILNEYFKTYDFSVTSVFFYYKDGKFYAGPPWDYDLSMGNENAGLSSQRCQYANSPKGVFANQNLFAFIANKDWFKDMVKTEYEAHYNYFSNIHTDGGILDTFRSTYSDTINRNYNEAGWQVKRGWINIQRTPDATYEENYAFLKNWLCERHKWFDEYFEPFTKEYVFGDTDGNGKVNIRDATYIQLILAKVMSNKYYELRGNVTGGELNINDATQIQKYLLGKNKESGIGEKRKARFD